MLKNKAWPALVATARVTAAHSLTFAAIGGAFAAVDVRLFRANRNNPTAHDSRAAQCIAESARGKTDFWNGVLGGVAAGSVLGLRGSSQPSPRCFAALTLISQLGLCASASAQLPRWPRRALLWTALARSCVFLHSCLRQASLTLLHSGGGYNDASLPRRTHFPYAQAAANNAAAKER